MIKSSGTKRTIEVRNIGEVAARNVKIELVNKEYLKVITNNFPAEIQPNCSADYSFQKYGYASNELRINVKWNDELKSDNSIEQILDIS